MMSFNQFLKTTSERKLTLATLLLDYTSWLGLQGLTSSPNDLLADVLEALPNIEMAGFIVEMEPKP